MLPKPLEQQQPNRASCLITSFAIILGVPVKRLIDQIGHDGTEIISDLVPEPLCYRGHHLQECTYICFTRGFAVVPFEPRPVMRYTDDETRTFEFKWFEEIVKDERGVMIGKLHSGKPHAMAWDGQYGLDPSGVVRRQLDEMIIRTFAVVVPIDRR